MMHRGSVPTKDMQTRTPSVLIPFSWKMYNLMKQMKTKISDFFNFLFFEISWKFIENLQFLKQKWRKITTTRKIKIWKYLFFSLFRRFRIFHVNLTTFEIFIFLYSCCMPMYTDTEQWNLAFLVCRWYQLVPTRVHQS